MSLTLMEDDSNWVERLLLNLLSYSVVLIPIAIVVIVTRYRLCPLAVQNNPLVQWFVHGRTSFHTARLPRIEEEDDGTILIEDEKNSQKESPDHSYSTLTLIWCLVGLQVSYLLWGYLQEKIMTTKYEVSLSESQRANSSSETRTAFITFHDSQFLVFVNRITAFLLSIIAIICTTRKRRINLMTHASRNRYRISRLIPEQSNKPSAPLYEYVYSSLSNILSSWCQYEALKYVNFPTQCLSKSCKVIPVMLMSKILLNKKYQVFDYVCALLLVSGMFIFLLYQPVNLRRDSNHREDGPKHNASKSLQGGQDLLNNHSGQKALMLSGLIILALYLTFDSFTSNWQQSLYGRYQISNWQMMAATNFYSILLTLTSLHQLGNLEPALKLLAKSNLLLRDCLLMSIMSSVGQMFVYYTIKRFGSVIFAVIMTLRQFLSILLSCLIYGHSLSAGSVCGLMLVFAVVGYQTWNKSKSPGKRSVRNADGGSSGVAANQVSNFRDLQPKLSNPGFSYDNRIKISD